MLSHLPSSQPVRSSRGPGRRGPPRRPPRGAPAARGTASASAAAPRLRGAGVVGRQRVQVRRVFRTRSATVRPAHETCMAALADHDAGSPRPGPGLEAIPGERAPGPSVSTCSFSGVPPPRETHVSALSGQEVFHGIGHRRSAAMIMLRCCPLFDTRFPSERFVSLQRGRALLGMDPTAARLAPRPHRGPLRGRRRRAQRRQPGFGGWPLAKRDSRLRNRLAFSLGEEWV